MTKQQLQLTEIVRLKKRVAESDFKKAMSNLQKLDERIENMRSRIVAANSNESLSSGIELQGTARFVQRLMTKMTDLFAQRTELLKDVDAARQKLKSIILSEDVLSTHQWGR